jgi:hypothetical protein
MNRIATIICLVIINNFTFSQQNQFHEDIFLNSFSNETDMGSSSAKSEPSKTEFNVNLDWDDSQPIDKVILINKSDGAVTILAGDLSKNLTVRRLEAGLYQVGYFYKKTCMASETLIVSY